MFKKFLLWIEHFFKHKAHIVPPVIPPVVPHILPSAPLVGYGPLDANGFCTVDAVEALRAEIAQKDSAYHLAHYYLCPTAIAAIADTKDRVAAQWQASQVAYWNMSAFQGGGNPFYPGVVVEISVKPGKESLSDDNPLKWNFAKGVFIDGDNLGVADHVGVSSQHAGADSGSGIASLARGWWVEDARRRGVKVV